MWEPRAAWAIPSAAGSARVTIGGGHGDERGPGVMNTGMPAGNSSPGGGSPTMCPGH